MTSGCATCYATDVGSTGGYFSNTYIEGNFEEKINLLSLASLILRLWAKNELFEEENRTFRG